MKTSSVRLRPLLAIVGLGGTGFLGGCSSIPILPEDGVGGSFNLATTRYVKESDGVLEERVASRILGELPANLEGLLVEDRRRVSQLQERVLSQETEIERLGSELDVANTTLVQLSELLASESEAFRASTEELRGTATRLEDAIQVLPTETIRQLSDALDAYLQTRPPTAEAARPTGNDEPKPSAESP